MQFQPVFVCQIVLLFFLMIIIGSYKDPTLIITTSVGLSISPGWKTPFSLRFPTVIANPGLKAPFSPGCYYQPGLNGSPDIAPGLARLVPIGVSNRY
jgi:hypothetical protein